MKHVKLNHEGSEKTSGELKTAENLKNYSLKVKNVSSLKRDKPSSCLKTFVKNGFQVYDKTTAKLTLLGLLQVLGMGFLSKEDISELENTRFN